MAHIKTKTHFPKMVEDGKSNVATEIVNGGILARHNKMHSAKDTSVKKIAIKHVGDKEDILLKEEMTYENCHILLYFEMLHKELELLPDVSITFGWNKKQQFKKFLGSKSISDGLHGRHNNEIVNVLMNPKDQRLQNFSIALIFED